MLRREQIERLKERYPAGTVIRLGQMEGEHQMPSGMEGKVIGVDDIGQIHVEWENGSTLALNVEEDDFSVVPQKETLSEKKCREFLGKVNEILKETDFYLLNVSCNGGDTAYAAQKLLAMHQAFETVYGNYMLTTISSVMHATVKDSENRMARAMYKLAVETSKLSHVIAYSHGVDEQALGKLQAKCAEEVKRINGAVRFEDAYQYQQGDRF